MELLGGLFFLIVGICGCIYPFTVEKNQRFEKSDVMYCDGDNT